MLDNDDSVYSIYWTDIEKGGPVVPKLVDSQAEDIFVIRKGVAILYKNGELKLPRSIIVDSKSMPADIKWSAIEGASNRWIVAGNNKGHSILTTLSTKGLVQSSLMIKLTHNGYWPKEYATLKHLKVAVERKHNSLILAFGTDGCCHLISMRRSGQLILVQSIASILDTNVNYDYDDANKTTFSVTDTGVEGRFIVAGYKQMNMISLKFK